MSSTPPPPVEADEIYHLEPRSQFDTALIGYDDLTNRAVYSRELLINVIVEHAITEINEINEDPENGETIELDEELIYSEAIEQYHYNILNTWLGEGTPIFISSAQLRDD